MYGYMDVISWLKDQVEEDEGLHSMTDSCLEGAWGGHPQVIQWLREEGFSWGAEGADGEGGGQQCFEAAALGGHLEMMTYLMNENIKFISPGAMDEAARGGKPFPLFPLALLPHDFANVCFFNTCTRPFGCD